MGTVLVSSDTCSYTSPMHHTALGSGFMYCTVYIDGLKVHRFSSVRTRFMGVQHQSEPEPEPFPNFGPVQVRFMVQ